MKLFSVRTFSLVVLLSFLGVGVFSPLVQAAPLTLSAPLAQPNLAQKLSTLPVQAKVRIESVPLGAAGSPSVALSLEKFTVFAPDAVVVLDSGRPNERRIAPPALAYFRGEVDGHPGSSAFWSVDESGHMKGVLQVDGQTIVTEQKPGVSASSSAGATTAPVLTQSRAVDKAHDFAGQTFQCGVDHDHTLDFLKKNPPAQMSTPQSVDSVDTVYSATVAVETDYEFFQLFGDTTKATRYVADLFGYVSTLYMAEVKTHLLVGNVYLYSNSNDPWGATTSPAALSEVQAFWQANRSGVARTITHFLSGKKGGGGLATIGGLCNQIWGYGLSMDLNGDFTPGNPLFIWDTGAVAHEIGHNFGASHTHDWDVYNEGSAVDCCVQSSSGTCAKTFGMLPGIGSLSGGIPGVGAGTIMSYCPSLQDLNSFTFGLNHPYGIQAFRVPAKMRTAVAQAAAANPACIPSTQSPTYTLTVTSTGASGVAITASPLGYAGTSNYSQTGIAAGSTLTLTAPGIVGTTVFSGWAGCDQAEDSTCSLTMTSSKTVTANYVNGGRYIKIANNGTRLPDTASLGAGPTDWACTFDNTTRLTWEVKTTDGGLRDINKTYTNYDDPTQAQKKSGTPTQTEIDATSNSIGFVNSANTANLCGGANWRVPSGGEIVGLLDKSFAPTINPSYFPNTPSSYFWTNSAYTGYLSSAAILNFADGADYIGDRSSGYHLRLVRGGSSYGSFSLSLRTQGAGSGNLTSNTGGLQCTISAGMASGTCSTTLPSGTLVTLTATPKPGYTFGGWSGACSGTNPSCTVTMAAIKSVTAIFALPAGVAPPTPPTITSITAGRGSATLTLSPPASIGGSALTAYTATCTTGHLPAKTATGTGLTLTVKGLLGNLAYACSATASNAYLTSSATALQTVTPQPGGSLTPILMLLLD